jgi:hypothetical protein
MTLLSALVIAGEARWGHFVAGERIVSVALPDSLRFIEKAQLALSTVQSR